MKYRVIQRMDGSFKTQYRSLFLWWCDSTYASSHDLQDQIQFARACTPRHEKGTDRATFKEVVWR